MLRTIIAALLGCMAFSVASVASTHVPALGCATYSATGKLAVVTIRDGRDLSLDVGNTATRASMTLPFAVTGCRAFFSQASDLLAVGLDVPLQQSREVNLLLLNPNSMEWVTPKPVGIRVAEDSRGPLLGFVGATHVLLMVQPGEYSPSEDRTTVFVANIDPFEHNAKTSALAVPGKYVRDVSVVPQLRDDKLWLVEGENGDCQLRAYHADGNATHGSAPIAYSDCPGADLLVALPGGTLLEVNHAADSVAMHHLNAQSASAPSVRVPADGSQDRYWYAGEYALSPDGDVLAISAKRVHPSRWGGTRISNEIVLLDTNTSKVLGRVPFAQLPREFAVASSPDECTVSWLKASGWESRTLPKAGE
jgi:DNA-binding beta-propeller fold protein YncE